MLGFWAGERLHLFLHRKGSWEAHACDLHTKEGLCCLGWYWVSAQGTSALGAASRSSNSLSSGPSDAEQLCLCCSAPASCRACWPLRLAARGISTVLKHNYFLQVSPWVYSVWTTVRIVLYHGCLHSPKLRYFVGATGPARQQKHLGQWWESAFVSVGILGVLLNLDMEQCSNIFRLSLQKKQNKTKQTYIKK